VYNIENLSTSILTSKIKLKQKLLKKQTTQRHANPKTMEVQRVVVFKRFA